MKLYLFLLISFVGFTFGGKSLDEFYATNDVQCKYYNLLSRYKNAVKSQLEEQYNPLLCEVREIKVYSSSVLDKNLTLKKQQKEILRYMIKDLEQKLIQSLEVSSESDGSEEIESSIDDDN